MRNRARRSPSPRPTPTAKVMRRRSTASAGTVVDVDRAGTVSLAGLTGGNAREGTAVVATIDDPDGNPTTATYTFSSGATVLQTGTSNSYTPGYAESGETISVAATYTDGQGHASTINASAGTVVDVDRAGTLSLSGLTGGNAREGTAVVATISDPDGNPVSATTRSHPARRFCRPARRTATRLFARTTVRPSASRRPTPMAKVILPRSVHRPAPCNMWRPPRRLFLRMTRVLRATARPTIRRSSIRHWPPARRCSIRPTGRPIRRPRRPSRPTGRRMGSRPSISRRRAAA